MLSKKQSTRQPGFYGTFEEQLSHRHPFHCIFWRTKIQWGIFEKAFAELYAAEGRPAKPIRLMVS